MVQVLLIALGGSLGAVARYGVSMFVYRSTNEIFPWGTLWVNISGSLFLGIAVQILDVMVIPPAWRAFLAIGFLGAYTTFSTYTLETVNLLRDGELGLAAFNIVANNAGGLLCVVLGMYLCRLFLRTLS